MLIGAASVILAAYYWCSIEIPMFDNLTDRLGKTLQHIRGQARLTEDNIKGTLREVRMALLEADVALPVVKAFIEQVKVRAVGAEVSRSLSPGQVFVKIVQQELEAIMGNSNEDLNLAVQPPAVILMAGLQGAGKTTSAAKLAKFLIEKKKKHMVIKELLLASYHFHKILWSWLMMLSPMDWPKSSL